MTITLAPIQEISLAERFARLGFSGLETLSRSLSEQDCEQLLHDWDFWCRPAQRPPIGDWHCWLVMAGRGYGKTRMGAEWVRSHVEGSSPLIAVKGAPGRIALIAQTSGDGRIVMVEGDSGLLAISPPDQRPKYEPSLKRLTWPNGNIAHLYSADEPDQMRGPQHGLAWADELAKWRHAEAAWSNLMFGLRMGLRPQVVVTTTPRPMRLLKRLLEDKTTIVTRGSSFDNRAHLAPSFMTEMIRLYEGTRLGRQELHGVFLDDIPGALWQRDQIEKLQVTEAPNLRRIVVAVDPPVTSGKNASRCGIIVAGRGENNQLFILADESRQGLSPHGWASAAVAAYNKFGADRLVAEINNGGELVEALIRQVDERISYRAVRASRGKITRAEPVAALYERGLVHHVGSFPELEDEMTSYSGEPGDASPDRMDALVWAITDLALGPRAKPRIRSF